MAILAGLWLVMVVGTAQAAQKFGIGPVYQNDQYKGWLIYELKPGDVMDDEIFVANASDKEITLRLYAQDALNTTKTSDGFKVPDEGTTPENMKFISKWITLEKSIVTLSPYSKEKIKIKTTIPLTAENRDYAAVIFAHNDPGNDSIPQNVKTNRGDIAAFIGSRIGVREYIKVTDTPNMPKRYIETDAASIDIMAYLIFGVMGLMIIGGAAIIIHDKRQKNITKKSTP